MDIKYKEATPKWLGILGLVIACIGAFTGIISLYFSYNQYLSSMPKLEIEQTGGDGFNSCFKLHDEDTDTYKREHPDNKFNYRAIISLRLSNISDKPITVVSFGFSTPRVENVKWASPSYFSAQEYSFDRNWISKTEYLVKTIDLTGKQLNPIFTINPYEAKEGFVVFLAEEINEDQDGYVVVNTTRGIFNQKVKIKYYPK